MREHYVTDLWQNIYLYSLGFDYARIEITPRGPRLWYENTNEFQDALAATKEDEWLPALKDAHRKINNDIWKAKQAKT